MARVEVDPGLSLQCDVDDYLWPWTKATPVLMVHGFSRNASAWSRWVPYLAQDHRVYRLELRGCGRSDVPPEPYRFDTDLLFSDLLKVLDHFSLERVHYVGESSSGEFGAAFALAHPDRIASLVLCETTAHMGSWISETYSVGEESAAAAMRRYGVAEWCRRTLSHRLDLERASPELAEWYVAQIGKTPPHVAGAMFGCFAGIDLKPVLKDIQPPVLLLTGDKEGPTSVAEQQAMQRAIPHARLQVFPGYRHGVYLLAAEACAQAAAAFWRDVDSGEFPGSS